MWNLVSVHWDTTLVLVQDRCMVCAKVPQAQKSFWMHPMALLGDEGEVETRFGPVGDSPNLDAR
jgi:hypothetical protein